MADETKKYLINIESNLKQYADDAAAAKKKVDDLKASNDELKKSGTATAAEMEANNAALRSAQKDYTNAKKSVDLVTQANKAQAGSYEQLYKQWQLAQVQLKLTGDAMIKNADGTYSLSQKHMQAKTQVTNLKSALDNFGKSVHDNRLNVGSYSEAIDGAIGKFSMLPGPIGAAAAQVGTFSKMLIGISPLLIGIGAVAAGAIALIVAPFAAFLKWSQEGMDLLAQKTNGFKAAIVVLKGELVNAGKNMTDGLGSEKNASKIENLINVTKKFFTVLTGGFFESMGKITGTTKYFDDLKNKMDDAAKSAQAYTKQSQLLEQKEIAMIVPRAKTNLALKEARILYSDITKSAEVRRDALKGAITLENKTADDEIKLNDKRVANELMNVNGLKASHQDTRDAEKKYQELIAKGIELKTESLGREIKNSMRINTLDKEILADKQKLLTSEEKLRELAIKMEIDSYKAQKSALKSAYDEQISMTGLSYNQREKLRIAYENNDALLSKKAIAKQKEILAEQLVLQLKEVDTIIQPERLANAQKLVIKKQYDEAYALLDDQADQEEAKRDQTKRERKKKVSDEDIKAGFEAQKLKVENKKIGNFDDLDTLNTLLNAEYGHMLASVEYEKMTTNQKLLIEEQYNAAKKSLSLARVDQIEQEKQVVADAFGAMADVLGKNTIVGKAMGIAQATINTWIAASKALATYPPPFNFIAMATAITAGLLTVANIVKVKVPDRNTTNASSSGPTSITTSAPHIISPATTILTPQLSQGQLNAVPNSGILSAKDIASAVASEFKKLPAPVVTVEAYENVAKSKTKIEVRANI